ncbi:hypothetical protein ACMD2_25966, partial [Ananas comosus]
SDLIPKSPSLLPDLLGPTCFEDIRRRRRHRPWPPPSEGALPRAAAGAAALVEARRHLSVLSTADDLPPPPPHANGGVGAPLGAKGPASRSPLPAPPSLSRAWADKPGFRWWKDKEAEILSVIEPIIALAKDILPSPRIYSTPTGMADIFLEKSQKSRCGGGYCRREASILDRLQHSNSNFQ